jgi:hypothetical protein
LWVLVDVLNICEDASKDMIRFARVVLHPVEQIHVKRSSKQQWDNKGKQSRIDTTEPTMKKRGHIAKDCWFKKKHRRCCN